MKNNVRLNAIKQISEGLVICNESIDKGLYDYTLMSQKIENEIYILSGNDSSVKCYRDKIKEILKKMNKTEFDSFKKKVLSESIMPSEFIVNILQSNDKTNSEINDTHNNNNVKMTQTKKSILAPPKVRFHSRSSSSSFPQNNDSNNSNSNIKDNYKKKELIVETNSQENKSHYVTNAFKKNNNSNTNKDIKQDKIIIEDNKLKLSNDADQIGLLTNSNSCLFNNELENIISSSIQQQNIIEECHPMDNIEEKYENKDKKKIFKMKSNTKINNSTNENNQKEISNNNSKINKTVSTLPPSPKHQMKRHYSYSDIQSNQPYHNTQLITQNTQLLELQIANKQSESQSHLYQIEIESLRKELLAMKEQSLSLSIKNLKLTTELKLKSETITKLQKTIESQRNLLNQYNQNYFNLKAKVENNSDLLEKKMNKFMIDFTKLSNKYDESSLSKLEDANENPNERKDKSSKIKPQETKPLSKPLNNKPGIDLFSSTDNDLTFSMLINKNSK